jgi:hypothetical protein
LSPTRILDQGHLSTNQAPRVSWQQLLVVEENALSHFCNPGLCPPSNPPGTITVEGHTQQQLFCP